MIVLGLFLSAFGVLAVAVCVTYVFVVDKSIRRD